VWEPIRPADPLGYAIYDPEKVFEHVEKAWAEDGGQAGFAVTWYEVLEGDETQEAVGRDAYAIELNFPLPLAGAALVRDLSIRINRIAGEPQVHAAKGLRRQVLGVLAWAPRDRICTSYFGFIPDRLDELVSWSEALGIPLRGALTAYLAADLQLRNGIPITLVVPRPQRLMGSTSTNELLNFVALAGSAHSTEGTAWRADTPVRLSDQRTPISVERARELSGDDKNTVLPKGAILGVGALGSKIALHLARAGQTDLTLIDFDDISPHNLVRHALLGGSRGKKKASALKEEIERIYPGQSLTTAALDQSALPLLLGDQAGVLAGHIWILDATASPIMLNAAVAAVLPPELRLFRAEIADMGRLGLLFGEGPARNPRLDDLQVMLFDSALQSESLARWLRVAQEERTSALALRHEEIQIGLSCSSVTMRLADELVSYHAASNARALRHLLGSGAGQNGVLQVAEIAEDGCGRIERLAISPVAVIKARNDPAWQVRLAASAAADMRSLLREHRPRETGGLLIGFVHSKRRVVYVSRVIQATPDSFGTPFGFLRGTLGLPEEVRCIENRTGGLLGYVGEWHTHPSGGPELSWTDRHAVAELKQTLQPSGLPIVIVVVTPRGLYPHVFSNRRT
jgi:integrative and conjugative element protein (TIGR02256 family)